MDTKLELNLYSRVLANRLSEDGPGGLPDSSVSAIVDRFSSQAQFRPQNIKDIFSNYLESYGSELVGPIIQTIQNKLEQLEMDKEVEAKAKARVLNRIKRLNDMVGTMEVEIITDGKIVETIGGKTLKEKSIEMFEAHGAAQGWKNKKNFRFEIEVR